MIFVNAQGLSYWISYQVSNETLTRSFHNFDLFITNLIHLGSDDAASVLSFGYNVPQPPPPHPDTPQMQLQFDTPHPDIPEETKDA